jgi:hypothetical protein
MTELRTCGCIKMVNKELAQYNTAIDTVMTFGAGKIRERLCVPTSKVDKKKRGTAMKVFATYCPMCGVEIPKDPPKQPSEPESLK